MIENRWIFWKQFWNIWSFILLLAEDDLALKIAEQITFRRTVAYKGVACKTGVYEPTFILDHAAI